MVDLGGLGAHIPILNLVPPARAAQVLGILGIVLLCIALSGLPERNGVRLPLIAAITCGLITVYALSLLRQNYLPTLSILHIGLATIGTMAAVFLVTWRPRSVWTIAAASGLAASVAIASQPILFGLSDLRDSETAKYLAGVGSDARAEGTMWASDSGNFDAVMLANGVPSLSGYQRSGQTSRNGTARSHRGIRDRVEPRRWVPPVLLHSRAAHIHHNERLRCDLCGCGSLHAPRSVPDTLTHRLDVGLDGLLPHTRRRFDWSGQKFHTYSFVETP